MERPVTYDRSWSTTQGLVTRWIETSVLMFGFLVLRIALGVDDSLDWGLWFNVVAIAAIVFTLAPATSPGGPAGTEGDDTDPRGGWATVRAVALFTLEMVGLGLFYLAGSHLLGSGDDLDWVRWALMSVAAATAYAAIRFDDRRRGPSQSTALD